MKLYKKVGKRYKEVGREFIGFPSDGIWFVKDGRQSCMIQLHDINTTNIHALPYLELVEKFFDERWNKTSYSPVELARELAMFFAEHVKEENNG